MVKHPHTLRKRFPKFIILLVILAGLALVVRFLLTGSLTLQNQAANTMPDLGLLTQSVTNDITTYKNSPTTENYTKLLINAQKRHALLLEELKNNPQAFLTHVLPKDIRDTLPQKLVDTGLFEEDIQGQGTVILSLIDNPESKIERKEYVFSPTSLQIKGTKRNTYRLFISSPNQIPSSYEITLSGISLGGNIATLSIQSIGTAIKKPTTVGKISIAVILFNFSDVLTKPITLADENLMLFGTKSVASWFDEASFSQLTISGDIFGWYSIPNSITEMSTELGDCNYRVWGKSALQKAQYDMEKKGKKYDRIIALFPDDGINRSKCTFRGVADILNPEDETSVSIYLRYIPKKIPPLHRYVHELGHTLGLNHAYTYDCDINISKCVSDPFDPMSHVYEAEGHYNSYYKYLLGWINQKNIIDRDGEYKLYNLEKKNGDLQIIEIPTNDPKKSYYLEYRRLYGFEETSPLGLHEDSFGATFIRLVDENFKAEAEKYALNLPTFLIDTNFDDSNNDNSQKFDNAFLTDGQTYYDPNNRISITQLHHNEDFATIEAKFQTPNPIYTPVPTLTPDPSHGIRVVVIPQFNNANPPDEIKTTLYTDTDDRVDNGNTIKNPINGKEYSFIFNNVNSKKKYYYADTYMKFPNTSIIIRGETSKCVGTMAYNNYYDQNICLMNPPGEVRFTISDSNSSKSPTITYSPSSISSPFPTPGLSCSQEDKGVARPYPAGYCGVSNFCSAGKWVAKGMDESFCRFFNGSTDTNESCVIPGYYRGNQDCCINNINNGLCLE